jgi:hypothetical protein
MSNDRATPAPRPSLGPWIAFTLALALAPVGFLLWKLYGHGHAFPYWDAWELVPILRRIEAGGPAWAELWAQHNEHRIPVPRLIMIALAHATGWNTGYEVALGVLCALALLAALGLHALRAPADRDLPRPWWVLPIFSLLLCSWAQMENWIWGWQFLVYLSTAAVGIGLVLLAGTHPARFALALLLGVVATYSFANGLLYWFAAAPALALAGDLAPRARLRRGALWAAAALLCIGAYFIGFQKPEVTPSAGVLLEAPLAFLGYVVLYLGAPITACLTRVPWHGPLLFPVGPLHFLPGLAGLALLGAALAALLRQGALHRDNAQPWLGLVLFAGGSAVATAVGRAGYGLEQALTAAYLPIGALFWCGLAGLAALWLQPRQPLALASAATPAALALAGTLLMALLLAATARATREWEDVARWRHMGWEAVRAGHTAPFYLADLCHDPDRLRDDYLPWLAARGWAGLGPGAPPPRFSAADYRRECARFIENGLAPAALTYLQTAELLEPGHPDTEALRQAGQARFQPPAP